MEILSEINWLGIIYAVGLLIIGFVVANKVSTASERAVSKRFSRHQAALIRRLVYYSLLLLFIFSALQQLGFKLTVLLGAAGVMTVALSFAAQTAASNLVSGIFLIFECPFKVGDVIKIKDMIGSVESMDLLSTKIQTADNMRIRIPNETIVKSEILNMSYYQTRRVDIILSVPYDSDLDKVKNILKNAALEQDDVLNDPAPGVVINNLGGSTIEVKLMAWTATALASSVKNDLNDRIKKRFDEENLQGPVSK